MVIELNEKGDLRSRLLDRVNSVLRGYIDFYDGISRVSEPGWPTFSQAIRMKALLDNKRILVADDTGVNGKTFVAVASKVCIDREKKKRTSALVVAPNSGLVNAWASQEINRYAANLRAPEQNVVTIRDFKDLDNVDKDADFTIINWEKLSVDGDDGRRKKLDEVITRLDPNFYVLDECHNAKGTTSLRGKTVRSLVEHTIGDYVMPLSATPIPNRYRDLGMIFHILDPVKYNNPNMFSHCGPEVMKELLDRQVWFRLTRQDLKEELGLPEFKEFEVPVNLTDEEAEIYFKGWADCVLLGEGLTELRKALYNARLSKYSAGYDAVPSKLKKVKELTDKLISEGHKVIIKTNYVENVIDRISEYVGNNALVVQGATPLNERRNIYLKFRNSKLSNVLVTSQVSEESVDLTTGDVPCSLISVEPAMSPREDTQFTGRVYRRGQKADVSHYILVSQSPVLDKLMINYLESLVKQYDVKMPKKFRPRTVDADMLAMRRAKEAIVEKIYGGNKITKQEESVYDANEVDRAVTHLEGLVAPSNFKSMKPFEIASLIQARWRNLGEDQFDRLVRTRGWNKWRRMYEEGWNGSASQATLKLIGGIVDGLEDIIGYEPVIVDEGSGAAYFSRATGKNVICLDIDPKFLKAGKKICDKKEIKNKYLVGKATETGLPDDSADIVVNGYMIFYLGQDKNRTEIEDCVLEKNRILKNNGYYVIALPYTVEDNVVSRFNKNLRSYGFDKVTYLDRDKTECANMKKGCHILVYQKVKDCSDKLGLDLSFYDNRVRFIQ